MGEILLHCAVAALATFAVGMIWYNPKVFGTAWMHSIGMTEEKMKAASAGRNMAVVFILCFVFAFFAAFVIQGIVVHQFGAYGMIGGDEAHALPSFKAFMADYGTAFRTFKHGVLHGTIAGVFLAFPMVAINAMFEMKPWKYVFINAGYWTVCFALMGGILCAWV